MEEQSPRRRKSRLVLNSRLCCWGNWRRRWNVLSVTLPVWCHAATLTLLLTLSDPTSSCCVSSACLLMELSFSLAHLVQVQGHIHSHTIIHIPASDDMHLNTLIHILVNESLLVISFLSSVQQAEKQQRRLDFILRWTKWQKLKDDVSPPRVSLHVYKLLFWFDKSFLKPVQCCLEPYHPALPNTCHCIEWDSNHGLKYAHGPWPQLISCLFFYLLSSLAANSARGHTKLRAN